MLLDAGDGTELVAKAPDREVAIASATKLMTAYVALQELRLKDELVAPRYEALAPESLMGLKQGEMVAVSDLVYGLLLASGNDAAVTLAEGASGSVDAFVRDMNRAADELALMDTAFANPIGLDAAGNHSSAADLAELTIELRRDPFFRKVVDTPEITVTSGDRPRRIVNRNNLVFEYPFVNGVKTGFTGEAGNVLVGSGKQKGVTLISVVLGAPSEMARDAATLELLEYGFSLYGRETIVEKGAAVEAVPIAYRDEELRLEAGREVREVLRRGQDVETEVASAPSEVEGPIERGEGLGTLTVTVDGDEKATVPLVAAKPVAAPTAIERIDAALPGGREVLLVVPGAAAAVLIGVAWSRSHRRHRLAVARRKRRNGQRTET